MKNTEFKKGTEFELHGEEYIVKKLSSDGAWIYYNYKDGRSTTIEEQGNMQFMPRSDNWRNSNIL